MTILDEIKHKKNREVEQEKFENPLSSLEKRIARTPPPQNFIYAIDEKIKNNKIALIAEIKRASPSKGIIREDFNVTEIAKAYQKGGAACLSVLTDKHFFHGDANDLALAKEASRLPVLRKDFVIDPYQVFETRAMRADCILLILAMLEENLAKELETIALRLDMGVLIEVHDEHEAERALMMKSRLIGINNRNLADFSVDIRASAHLSKKFCRDHVIVSESGISRTDEVFQLVKSGFKTFLIGEQLMRAADIEQATRIITSI